MLVTVAKLKSADVVAICLPCNVTFDVHDMRIVIANIWSQSLRDYIVTINDKHVVLRYVGLLFVYTFQKCRDSNWQKGMLFCTVHT